MNNLYPFISGVTYESLVDGEGVRTVLFLSGCPHHCDGCQNPETWSPTAGQPITDLMIQEIAENIQKRPFVRGITLSGGDPLYSPSKTWSFFKALREEVSKFTPPIHGKSTNPCDDLWIYTGYTMEELWSKQWDDPMDRQALIMLLSTARILVDGRYEKDLTSRKARYRGSTNQRLVDLENTIAQSLEEDVPTVVVYQRHEPNKSRKKV